jgi:hypothetical protein
MTVAPTSDANFSDQLVLCMRSEHSHNTPQGTLISIFTTRKRVVTEYIAVYAEETHWSHAVPVLP